ncbi:MAG TPA: ABC transporter permease [Xanthomonadaceae bacterium]|nr:ABC transporter permease [Xanthomonadaceae bacterium]
MPLSHWIFDLRHGARTLRRTPGFTVVAVTMLALAIAATASLFAVVRAVLLEPLPFAQPHRLVNITGTAPGSQLPEEFGLGAEFVVHYRERSQLLQEVAPYNSFTHTLRLGDRAERLRMSMPTHALLPMLGAQPVLGRLSTDADGDGAVVISDRLWAEWFGREPGVIGRSVLVFGEPRQVVGVLGSEFRFPNDDTLLWIPTTLEAADINQVGSFQMNLVGRLAPGATPDAVATELTALARELPGRFGGSAAYGRVIERFQAVLRPLEEQLLGPFARPLWVLLGAAGLVLLIACANLANLLLVRADTRHRELAVRHALGAGRRQLLRLQLAEALLVALMAGALAVVLAWMSLPAMLALAPQGVPRLDRIGIDAATLGFTLATALLSGLLCGLLPALRGARPDLARLRDGGRGIAGGRQWMRHALVAGQTALALVLLIGSGLLLRSVHALAQVDPGFDPRDVFTFQIAPEQAALNDAASFARFHLDFLERLAALPGVESVGLVENAPIDEGTPAARVHSQQTLAAGGDGELLKFNFTAGDYFRSMGIELLAGRAFTRDDHTVAPGNVIVSRSAAARLWPDRDPIGMQLQQQQGDSSQPQPGWRTVVGVVGDVRQQGVAQEPEAAVYLPMLGPTPETSPVLRSPAYVIRTPRAETIAADVRALVREVAPEAPMYRQYTMEGLVAGSTRRVTFTLLTLGMAAGLALVLGAVGLYGVLSYVVSARTREIGVRMALGAEAAQVRAMIVRQGVQVVAIGVGVGLGAAAALTGALGNLLFGVEPLDLATFAAMAATMIAVGLLASYLPARRASRLAPMDSLRRE